MENHLIQRNQRRKNRAFRVRKTINGSGQIPRLTVFRSNKHIHAQIIDDESQKTLFGVGTTSKGFKNSDHAKKSKESAREIGKRIAQEAKKQNINRVIFDRGFYKYHGVIAELANAAREQGLQF